MVGFNEELVEKLKDETYLELSNYLKDVLGEGLLAKMDNLVTLGRVLMLEDIVSFYEQHIGSQDVEEEVFQLCMRGHLCPVVLPRESRVLLQGYLLKGEREEVYEYFLEQQSQFFQRVKSQELK